MSKLVIALGGNAIQTTDHSAAGQKRAIYHTMQAMAHMIQSGNQLVITYGNGPQVGNLLLQQQAAASSQNPAMPLDTVGAMTQGSIGYWMQQALDTVLKEQAIEKRAVSLVTQTMVDRCDPAFKNPSKPIGPFYSKDQLAKQQKEHPDFIYQEDAGRGYRQVVASPKPQSARSYNHLAGS